MIVGALLDAGVPFDWLRGELGKLQLNGYRLDVEDVKRGGIGGKKFQVKTLPLNPPLAKGGTKGGVVERKLGDIKKILENSTLSDDVKGLSIKVFERLAEAEARVHRVGVNDIHFHEVGGTDSIIDIVAASLSLSFLGIDKVYASGMPLAQGSVSCDHGHLPLPAPAVAELLKGVPVYQAGVKGELVTPTGAAFLSIVCKGYGTMPPMKLKEIGYGAGQRENEGMPNLLRVMIGEPPPPIPPLPRGGEGGLETDSVTVIEANIDDMNPELYGFIMERLLEEGALDASVAPVYMKKGRPGNLLQVICHVGREGEMANMLLRETSTIGVRFYKADRLKLPRRSVEVKTRFGDVRLKVAKSPWGDKAQPEYDDCRKAARDAGVPIQEIYDEAVNSFKRGGDDQ